MELVKETHEILKKKLQPFDFENPVMDPKELTQEMQRVRKQGGGIGLAANQIGIDARVIVIGMGDFTTDGVEDFAKSFFNPEITSYGKKEEYMIEGCLSFPGLFVKVKRPVDIEIKYFDEEGVQWLDNLTGITSRILQHEIDHLNGVTFEQRANRHHLEKAKKNRKLSDRYIERRKRLDIYDQA